MMLKHKFLRQLLDFACEKNNVTVFAGDTDIFILLLHFWNSDMGEMFRKANKKKNQIQKLVSVRKIAERLNPVIVKNILFIHAWSDCDTTSERFNKGKLFVTTYGMYYESF